MINMPEELFGAKDVDYGQAKRFPQGEGASFGLIQPEPFSFPSPSASGFRRSDRYENHRQIAA
jgi:hypothetical protein